MGSVKDLQILEKPEENKRVLTLGQDPRPNGLTNPLPRAKGISINKKGVGRFVFSDRYSVFDWGEMPDHVSHKGEALCLIGAYFFEKASALGINTHYRGLVDNRKVVLLSELTKPTNVMEIELVRVVYPKFNNRDYDYSEFKLGLKNFLIPLEIIYRNSLPEGSSVFRRLEKGETSLENLGLEHYPTPGEKLDKAIFDLSTKLEEKDRYISWEEAKKLAWFENNEVEKIKETLLKVNGLITKVSERVGLVNEDGKIELAYDLNRKLMLVDVIGTLDECRFAYNGIHVSKEVARQFYKRTEWYKDLQEAKKLAEEQKNENWKFLCKSKPEKLDADLKRIIEWMYTATANAFLGREIFSCPKLEDVVEEYEKWLSKHK